MQNQTGKHRTPQRLFGRLLKWLVGLALLAALLFMGVVYWYFYDNHAPKAPPFPLDVSLLRKAANTLSGAKPTHIEVEIISHTPVPKIAMVAGTSWNDIDLIRVSYRIISPHSAIILDTGHTEDNARAMGAKTYDAAAWTRTQHAIATADKVIITHAHNDHSGGLSASIGNAWLSPAQVTSLQDYGEPLPTDHTAIQFDDEGFQTLAPGIVLVAAPGHTPGSQLVFVQLESGREFLFMGDTASQLENITLGRSRSRFVMERISFEDRGAIFAQMRALQHLSDKAPETILVPGHDSIAIQVLIDNGFLKAGFEPEEPCP